MTTNYMKYRGKCKQYTDKAVALFPVLKQVRGYYHCPLWGKQEHWWCVRPDGSIFDPTCKQFPFGGKAGTYEEFNGLVECANCGVHVVEEEAQSYGTYVFCSGGCICRFVGV